jgi:hypothetical protein
MSCEYCAVNSDTIYDFKCEDCEYRFMARLLKHEREAAIAIHRRKHGDEHATGYAKRIEAERRRLRAAKQL